jgi:hypothetical protein
MIIFSSINISLSSSYVAIYKDGLSDTDLQVLELITDTIDDDKLIEVASEEEGKTLLNSGDVCFFICLNSDSDPVSATFYYDPISNVGIKIKENLTNLSNEYAYDCIVDFLSDYGVTLNSAYFNLITFEENGNTK